jgi:hypothetical protein
MLPNKIKGNFSRSYVILQQSATMIAEEEAENQPDRQ